MTSSDFAPLDVIIMQNIVQLENKTSPKVTFDLKGSTKNRKVKVDQFWKKSLNCKRCLKDLNYLEIGKSIKDLFMLTSSEYYQLQKIIKSDSLFLRKYKLMDYSLLLVIEGDTHKKSVGSGRYNSYTASEFLSLHKRTTFG